MLGWRQHCSSQTGLPVARWRHARQMNGTCCHLGVCRSQGTVDTGLRSRQDRLPGSQGYLNRRNGMQHEYDKHGSLLHYIQMNKVPVRLHSL